MQRRALFVLLLTASLRPAAAQPAPYDQGSVALGHRLLQLQTTARVLHVAAHPDDEDSALLAQLARGMGAHAIYLSLNRGEGGQNSIGPELWSDLGILRTSELLAARQLDGAEQTFGATYDFGFSKTAAEALRLWGEKETLGDIVLAIRRYRPQVVIQRFNGDPGDGHGHHQASGILCKRAFRAAADPQQYPEQIAAGYLPWQPDRLYLDRWVATDAPIPVALGDWLPLYGRTAADIAYEGRSRHRSQDMGHVQPLGEAETHLKLLDSADGKLSPTAGLFEGLDLTLPAAVPDVGSASQRSAHAALVEAAQSIAMAAASPAPIGLYPRSEVTLLAKALRSLQRAAQLIDETNRTDANQVATMRLALREKVESCQQALAAAAGLQVVALATRPAVTPGEKVALAVQAFAPRSTTLEAPRMTINAPAGWTVESSSAPRFDNGEPAAAAGFTVTVPSTAEPQPPYWLRQPRNGNRYAVADLTLLGRPFDPPLLTATARLVIDGAPLSLTVPVQYRWTDPRFGERRREVVLMPPAVGAPADALAAQVGTDPHGEVQVRLRSLAEQPLSGVQIGLGAPAGTPVALNGPDEVTLPLAYHGPTNGPQPLSLLAGGPAQPLYRLHVLEYEHVAPRWWITPATLQVAALGDVKVAADRHVGLIRTAEDETATALARLGLTPRLLDDAALLAGDFGGLDTIVVGCRAYETNDALRRANARLLDWARAGHTLVVMYQKYPFATGKFAPYPMTFTEPHDRVTDETAAVTLLAPEHPLLTTPNRIGPATFDGWVQERGLYFWHTWDAQYQPLLSAHDPGESEKQGGLLVAPLGRGQYVYCAYALFRQLPAGVPGAYALLANLVSYRS